MQGIKNPELAAFLEELFALCMKHNFEITGRTDPSSRSVSTAAPLVTRDGVVVLKHLSVTGDGGVDGIEPTVRYDGGVRI
jgi:hypothetical protein